MSKWNFAQMLLKVVGTESTVVYSLVSNRRGGVGIVGGGLEKNSKINSRGVGIIGGGWKNTMQ